MNAFLKYCLAMILTVAVFFIYGFTVGGEPPLWLHLAAGTICFAFLAIVGRKQTNISIRKKIISITVTLLLTSILSEIIYICINSTYKKTEINTYETVVTEVHYDRFDFSDVYFIDDSGNETYISLDPFSDFEEGAAIRVTEYTGLFDMEYCMLSDIN